MSNRGVPAGPRDRRTGGANRWMAVIGGYARYRVASAEVASFPGRRVSRGDTPKPAKPGSVRSDPPVFGPHDDRCWPKTARERCGYVAIAVMWPEVKFPLWCAGFGL